MALENMAAGNPAESERSPEELNHAMEQLLLSCERAGEGGKAVVLKLSVSEVRPELRPALDALQIPTSDNDKAIKLFKLSLPGKASWEYTMQQRAYEAVQNIPEDEREKFALVPALSSQYDVSLDDEVKREIGKRFGAAIVGDKTQIIAMEYIDGEDLATIFYKWILERENLYTPEETDGMNFAKLYEEVSTTIGFEILPSEMIDDPRALELAEWKNAAKNTAKLYEYLHKHNFPMPSYLVPQVENTIKLLHQSHITHGDAFERNLMVTGGMKALRSKKTLEGERSYVIDFGESKDHAVEGVDEFAVVRRLRKLTHSKEEGAQMAKTGRFRELDSIMATLQSRDKKWIELRIKMLDIAREDQGKALVLAWNRTAALDMNWAARFFALVNEGKKENLFSQEDISRFVKDKATRASAFEKRAIQEGLDWLGQT